MSKTRKEALPKEIWAWIDELAGVVGSTEEPETPAHMPPGPNAATLCGRYIRADLATAQVAAAYERAAELVAPNGERPCDCDGCYCGNPGDNAAVSEWDASHHDAQAIRALATSDQTDALEAVKREAREKALREAERAIVELNDFGADEPFNRAIDTASDAIEALIDKGPEK